MSPTPPHQDGPTPQVEPTPARRSKIPHGPTSSRAMSAGRRSPHSVSTHGSPSRTATPPLPLRDITSPSSKIPKAPHTPSNPLVTRSYKSRFGGTGTGANRSSLPRSRGSLLLETPTVKSPAAMVYQKPSPILDRNKPLPSPPMAQIIDPNSPPKAQRTLVDAQTATFTGDKWPILRPEDVHVAQQNLTTDFTVDQQQPQPEPQPNVSHVLRSSSNTNTPVNTRKTSPSSAPVVRTQLSTNLVPDENAANQPEGPTLSSEPRRLSSNNPYAQEYHAVSPTVDVAIDSPLARKKSRPATLSIPPRVSSKRSTGSLFGRDQPEPPKAPASAQVDENDFPHSEWPLSSPKSENASRIESSKFSSDSSEQDFVVDSTEPVTQSLGALADPVMPAPTEASASHTAATATPEELHALICENPEPEPQISFLEALDCRASNEDVLMQNEYESALSNTAEGPPGQGWAYDTASKYFTKTLSWKEEEPTRGPTLRIHRDSEAIILGTGNVHPEDPDETDPPSERASLGRSFAAIAGRMSTQMISSTTSNVRSPMQSPNRALMARRTSSPVVISPIRSMRPPRQSSAEFSPRSPSSVTGLPPYIQRTSPGSSQLALADISVAETPSNAKSALPVETANPEEESEEEATPAPAPAPSTPAKKARRILGLRKDTPDKNARGRLTPSWMAPTVSSMRSNTAGNLNPPHQIGRMSSRDVRNSGSFASTGTSSPSFQRTASRVGPSKLGTSISATPVSDRSSGANRLSRGTQTPNWAGQVPSPSPASNDAIKQAPVPTAAEAKKASTLRLKAKRSFRNLFQKSETKTSKVPQPVSQPHQSKRVSISKPSEAKRASIATSGKTLAKRISKNFSKAHLPSKTPDIPDAELQNLDALPKPQATVAAPEDVETTPVRHSLTTATLQCDTAAIVNKLVAGIATMSPPTSEGMRRLDIAEVLLQIAELVKQSQLCSEKTRKYAREAELHLEHVKIELGRLDMLMDFDFLDPELKLIIENMKILRSMVNQAAEKE